MSVISAGGGGGKNTFWNSAVFSSFDTVIPLLRAGMYDCVGIASMYFLTVHIVLPSAFCTNSLHVFSFAFFISSRYSSLLLIHSILFIILPDLLYIFRRWFASLRSFDRLSFHHRLLNGHSFLRGVVSFTARTIASVMSTANLST